MKHGRKGTGEGLQTCLLKSPTSTMLCDDPREAENCGGSGDGTFCKPPLSAGSYATPQNGSVSPTSCPEETTEVTPACSLGKARRSQVLTCCPLSN